MKFPSGFAPTKGLTSVSSGRVVSWPTGIGGIVEPGNSRAVSSPTTSAQLEKHRTGLAKPGLKSSLIPYVDVPCMASKPSARPLDFLVPDISAVHGPAKKAQKE